MPYIAVDTGYSTSDLGQITTRLTAFIEMIQAERPGDKEIDMNCCYKIVLSGSNYGNSKQEILEELWKYTGIPIGEYDRYGRLLASAGLEQASREGADIKIEKEYPGGEGKIITCVMPGRSEKAAEWLANILLQNYSMKKQFSQEGEDSQPDYLWVLAEKSEDLDKIYDAVEKDGGFLGQLNDPEGKNMFVSCIKGKEDRNRLVAACRKCMKDLEGQIVIGNGFQNLSDKEENRRLQERVLRLAGEKMERGNIRLTENYYYELAVECISEQMEMDTADSEEINALYKDGQEKGRELCETLYWYLRMKRNVASTAAKMKLHRNTLLPRIARLNEIMEVDAMEGADCERILLVMELERKKKDRGGNADGWVDTCRRKEYEDGRKA